MNNEHQLLNLFMRQEADCGGPRSRSSEEVTARVREDWLGRRGERLGGRGRVQGRGRAGAGRAPLKQAPRLAEREAGSCATRVPGVSCNKLKLREGESFPPGSGTSE